MKANNTYEYIQKKQPELNLYKRKSRILSKKMRELHFGHDSSVSNFELAWLNFWISFIESGGLRYVSVFGCFCWFVHFL